MAEVRLENLTKVFGEDVLAVDDVSLTIEEDELLVFLGPSGSGKSTALRLIAGLEKPSDGKIFIGGEDMTNKEPQDRNVSMVFQSFALYPHRTVRGNISFPLEARGVSDEEIDQKVNEAAEMLDIEELLDRKPAQLSGGQQQRVALGRALVRDPAVFLMDEPLANLDERLRKQMQTEMVRLQRTLKTTMVHVTHNQEEAMTMGDRVAIMNTGKIQQVAPGREAYRKPANRFVAQFIGSPRMNLLEGQIENGTFVTDDSMVKLSIPSELEGRWTAERVTLGIRPEAFSLVEHDGEHILSGTVEVIELTGDEQIIHVESGNHEILAKISAENEVSQGDTVHIDPRTERIHLFDGIEDESQRVEPP